MFLVLATLHIADVGNLLAGNETDEVALRECFQRVVGLRLRQSRLLGQQSLVDVAVVGKETAIVAEQGYDDTVLVGGDLFQAVQVVATYQKTYTGLVVGFLVIFDISGAFQNLQGRMDADGKMAETLAELLDIELMADSIAVAGGYLVVVGQVFVDLLDILTRWEGVVDTLGQLAVVVTVVEQDGTGWLSVTSRTPCLLKVSFDGVRTVVVDDQTDVGFVDTHSESVGGYHDAYGIVLPVALSAVLVGMVQSGMIEGGRESGFRQVLGNLAGVATTADIDNG